jgi:hypothetical protein
MVRNELKIPANGKKQGNASSRGIKAFALIAV